VPGSTASIRLLSAFGEYVQSIGRSPESIYAAAGFDSTLLADDSNYVPFSDLANLFEVAAYKLQDPCLGVHYAQFLPFGSLGPHDHLALSAKTVGEMLGFAFDYAELTIAPFGFSIIEEAQRKAYAICLPMTDGISNIQLGGFILTGLVLRVRHAAGEHWIPCRASFPHRCPAPDALEVYRSVLGKNIEFDAPEWEFVVPHDILRMPMPVIMAGLESTVRKVADDELIARRGSVDFVGQVAQVILRRLRAERPLLLDRVASSLNITSRALQWRLKQHNMTFERLLGNERKTLAIELLRDTGLSIAAIAVRLGFADASGFTRWSIRRFGMPPSEYRLLLQSGLLAKTRRSPP